MRSLRVGMPANISWRSCTSPLQSLRLSLNLKPTRSEARPFFRPLHFLAGGGWVGAFWTINDCLRRVPSKPHFERPFASRMVTLLL